MAWAKPTCSMRSIISVLQKAIFQNLICKLPNLKKTGFAWKDQRCLCRCLITLPVETVSTNLEKSQKTDQVVCIFRNGGKKEFSLNGVPYIKYSEHIGKYPCVMIAPDDIELVTGGSEERRRFIDTLISQVDAEYLQQLIIYTKVLQQRNSLLKRFAEAGKN
jgi:recombinational DNA repair ATPase RecF